MHADYEKLVKLVRPGTRCESWVADYYVVFDERNDYAGRGATSGSAWQSVFIDEWGLSDCMGNIVQVVRFHRLSAPAKTSPPPGLMPWEKMKG